jgi:catechol 2,3-dioxygenase-like lactoylglutathione lyase family enzyme
MHITRIDHVALDVTDRDRSMAWYSEVLGLQPRSLHGDPDEPIFVGPADAGVALFAKSRPGVRHVALASDPEGQRALVARLRRLGIPYRRERHAQTDSVYFADPDGTVLEVMVSRP